MYDLIDTIRYLFDSLIYYRIISIIIDFVIVCHRYLSTYDKINFIYLALLHMLNLIVDIDDQYPRRVSQRASAALAKIKAKFNAVGLKERAKTCPFRKFFFASELKFFGQIIHQLLPRKVRSNNKTEMQFLIGGQILRFGLIEFSFITELKFGQYPTYDVLNKMSSSKRLM